MRRARVDANHAHIVTGLRRAGCSVQSLATVGGGCPDLLVGCRGINTVLEVKDGDKPPSARQLTAPERAWCESWRGQVDTVKNLAEALAVVGLVG